MFTGIIEATGNIDSLEQIGGDLRAKISSDKLDFSDVKTGDSISVSGVCLTAVSLDDKNFTVDISNETLLVTSFAQLREGDSVNLEKAMQVGSRFGGHIVSGHVDGVAALVSKTSDGRSERLVFSIASELVKFIAAKGSVCLEGVSLTVNEVADNQFGVNIIPLTADQTTLGSLQIGGRVNLEVDIISRYLEGLMAGMNEAQDRAAAIPEVITREKLVRCGFANKLTELKIDKSSHETK